MINIIYNGRIIYNHIKDEDINEILLELALNEKVNEDEIEIEEI
jgi:(2Fe-2S) ferredoxin